MTSNQTNVARRSMKSTLKNSRLYAGMRRLCSEYRWQRRAAVTTPFGFQIIADDSVQSGHFEEEESSLLQRHLSSADLFVDIGANVGFYTCLARSRGVPVVAFEPETHNLRTLYRNLEINGFQDTEVWPIGLSDRVGLLKIYGGHTGASLVKGWAGISSDAWARTVPVNTLDNVLGHRFDDKQLLIKIDVEGAEYGVLQGAQCLLRSLQKKPVWVIEITQSLHRPVPNADFTPTFELFWQNGYEARTADSRFQEVTPADVHRWNRDGLPNPYMQNWYFAPAA